MSKRVTQAELSKILNVSRPYISKLVKNGKLKFDEDKTIDLDEALKNLKNTSQRITSTMLNTSTEDDVNKIVNSVVEDVNIVNNKVKDVLERHESISEQNLLKLKTINEMLKAENLQIELDKKKGSLVETEKVIAEAFSLGSFVRESFNSYIDRNYNILSTINDPLNMRNELTKGIYKVLEDCADEFEKNINKNFQIIEEKNGE